MGILANLGKFAGEAARAIRNFQYELSPGGIYLPKARATIGGVFRHAHAPAGRVDRHGNPIFGPWQVDPNRMVNEGLDYLLLAAFGGGAQITQFYLAPFSGDVMTAAGWTAANFPANATEFTAYTAATRLPWTTGGAVSAQAIGNSSHLADSTITYAAGGPYNLYGLALLSASAKGATTGKAAAATRFETPRTNQLAGDKLALEYVLQAKDEGDVG